MLMRSKVIYQGQGLSEVKLGGKCKICITFWKVEVQLQPDLICRCNMWTSYLVSGWNLVLVFWVIFMQVTMILEFPASYRHLARGIAQVVAFLYGLWLSRGMGYSPFFFRWGALPWFPKLNGLETEFVMKAGF